MLLIGKQSRAISSGHAWTGQSGRAAAQVVLCNISEVVIKLMNSMKTCNSVTFYYITNSFSVVSRKWILPNMTRAVPVPIILGKIHFLLTSENEFSMQYNVTELNVFHGIH